MKFNRKVKWISVSLAGIVLAGYLYIRYDNMHFLSYGVLHVKELPSSIKIIELHKYGLTDGRMEYDISLDKNEFFQLLKGRKYNLSKDLEPNLVGWGAGPQRYIFPVYHCYSSGSLGQGLVNIYVNKDSSKAYIVYTVD